KRLLSDAEIKTIWRACHDDDHGAIVKLLLLTGQRAAEIGSLRWDEVHDDHIALPETRTKNKHPHIIPLSAPAKAILANTISSAAPLSLAATTATALEAGACAKNA